MGHYTYKIEIKGTVQGVGFRPFIYKLATTLNLKGYIYNSGEGVEIVVNANKELVKHFTTQITQELPPLAKIDNLTLKQIDNIDFTSFTIKESQNSLNKNALLPPDISICKECESELFDPSNRRYMYPFITCTNCGVRYSIIENLPYDRANTSMKFFKMCKACEAEYTNPLDRRYHAQPIGCWDCGPSLSLWDNACSEFSVQSSEIIDRVVNFLLDGNILAIKGVGGYHLVCDATNFDTIKRLRELKKRPSKPFAVMVRDIAMAKEFAKINTLEEKLLSSKEKPIVLLQKSKSLNSTHLALSTNIAPNISKIGLFLPYTPLHLLILHKLNRPIVATSANFSDEPIATKFEDIIKLNSIYDNLLEHNREIVNGCDDSVLMVVKGQIVPIRRARGYTPTSVKLPFKLEQKVLSLGANQKSTIAIAFDDNAILSPHIGDLNSIESVNYYKQNIDTLCRIYNFKPDIIACDKHPNYESTKVAKELTINHQLSTISQIQHHYAHILSVMAEHKLQGKVLGVAFDGTGFGDDGKLWGGEFLLCDYSSYKRVAHFEYFKLLGGQKAIKEPKRVALSLLFECFDKEAINLDLPSTRAFNQSQLKTQFTMWQKGLNSPLSSSAGRLFDGVASLLGICQNMSFEGESGMLLEEQYNPKIKESYPFEIKDDKIDIKPMIKELTKEPNSTTAVSKFFNTLVEIVATIYKEYQDLPLILSGGVFQNRVLLELILERFPKAYIANQVPPNDGGIALGQVVGSRI